MFKGLYAAGYGMLAQMMATDTTANNIANVNSNGFKADRPLFKSFESMMMHRINDDTIRVKQHTFDLRPPIGRLGAGVYFDDNWTSFDQGSLHNTTNPLDVALSGEGFFTIQTPEGVRYTRDGNFTQDRAGNLVTQNGHFVLGTNGQRINVAGEAVRITPDGTVFTDPYGQSPVGRIAVALIADKQQVVKQGDGLFSTVANADIQAALPNNTGVRQGYLEMSNVQIVREMVKLIETQRMYEANSKMVQTFDESARIATTQLSQRG